MESNHSSHLRQGLRPKESNSRRLIYFREWDSTVVDRRRLQDNAESADNAGGRKYPWEKSVEHKSDVFPVLFYLKQTSTDTGQWTYKTRRMQKEVVLQEKEEWKTLRRTPQKDTGGEGEGR